MIRSLLPFWDCLFQFLRPCDQVVLMCTCSQLHVMGMRTSQLKSRILCMQRINRDRKFPGQDNPETCLSTIRDYGLMLFYVHPENLTREVCRAAFESFGGELLKYVPPIHRTSDICFDAVKVSLGTIKHVAPHHQTPELCRYVIEQSWEALKFIAPENQTSELCLLAMQNSPKAFRFVTPKHHTPEICLMAVKDSGNNLALISANHQTPEICMAAVQENCWAIEHVKLEHGPTPEMCVAALKVAGRELLYQIHFIHF